MTEDPKQRQEDPAAQHDERLVNELDSLYRRVASLDSPEMTSNIAENQDLYYKILQIPPNASLSDIHLAYEKMTSAWDPERCPHVPSWKETSAERLREIKNAYEKLLLLHEARETADLGDAIHLSPSTALLPFAEDPDPEEMAPVRPNVNASYGSKFKRRSWLFAPSALIVIALLLVFLWPTLYHYEAVRIEDKDYPLRINRLTTHTQFYDGRQWLEPPLRVETQRNIPSTPDSSPLSVQSTAVEIRRESQPASSPLTTDTSPLKRPDSLSVQSVGIRIRGESKPVLPPPAKQEIRPTDKISVKVSTGAPYSIQVSAYPARNKADALANEIQANKIEVRVEEVSIQDKGQWYRVLLGQFENRNAAIRYLKDHRIAETYPGSFIRKAVIQSK